MMGKSLGLAKGESLLSLGGIELGLVDSIKGNV